MEKTGEVSTEAHERRAGTDSDDSVTDIPANREEHVEVDVSMGWQSPLPHPIHQPGNMISHLIPNPQTLPLPDNIEPLLESDSEDARETTTDNDAEVSQGEDRVRTNSLVKTMRELLFNRRSRRHGPPAPTSLGSSAPDGQAADTEATDGQEEPTDDGDKLSEGPPSEEDADVSCRECNIAFEAQLDMLRHRLNCKKCSYKLEETSCLSCGD